MGSLPRPIPRLSSRFLNSGRKEKTGTPKKKARKGGTRFPNRLRLPILSESKQKLLLRFHRERNQEKQPPLANLARLFPDLLPERMSPP